MAFEIRNVNRYGTQIDTRVVLTDIDYFLFL
jgi:hypothetical protein